MDKFFKIFISISILLIGGSIFYYFVIFIPQKEQARIELERIKVELEQREKERNKANLDICLTAAEASAKNSFVVICKSDKRVSGGDNKVCEMGTAKDVIEFMNASYLRETLFKGILEKLEKDKAECFKRYPQK